MSDHDTRGADEQARHAQWLEACAAVEPLETDGQMRMLIGQLLLPAVEKAVRRLEELLTSPEFVAAAGASNRFVAQVDALWSNPGHTEDEMREISAAVLRMASMPEPGILPGMSDPKVAEELRKVGES